MGIKLMATMQSSPCVWKLSYLRRNFPLLVTVSDVAPRNCSLNGTDCLLHGLLSTAETLIHAANYILPLRQLSRSCTGPDIGEVVQVELSTDWQQNDAVVQLKVRIISANVQSIKNKAKFLDEQFERLQ